MSSPAAKRPRDAVMIVSWLVVGALVPLVAVVMGARAETTEVVVPRADIPAFQTLERRDVKSAERPRDAVRGAATSTSEVVGAITTRRLRAGRPVPSRSLIRRPAGLPASPVPVELRGPTVIGGPLDAGDTVLVARNSVTGAREVVAPVAMVLNASAGTVTLAVSPRNWPRLGDRRGAVDHRPPVGLTSARARRNCSTRISISETDDDSAHSMSKASQ